MDISWIADFFNSVTGFFQDIWTFIYSGIYELLKAFLVTLTKAMIYAYFQAMIFGAEIAYEVVQDIMDETGITREITTAWNRIPADMRSTLSFFNIPQGLTLIFTAIPTRLALKFVPFFGR